jgi:hypothetical protein
MTKVRGDKVGEETADGLDNCGVEAECERTFVEPAMVRLEGESRENRV